MKVYQTFKDKSWFVALKPCTAVHCFMPVVRVVLCHLSISVIHSRAQHPPNPVQFPVAQYISNPRDSYRKMSNLDSASIVFKGTNIYSIYCGMPTSTSFCLYIMQIFDLNEKILISHSQEDWEKLKQRPILSWLASMWPNLTKNIIISGVKTSKDPNTIIKDNRWFRSENNSYFNWNPNGQKYRDSKMLTIIPSNQ